MTTLRRRTFIVGGLAAASAGVPVPKLANAIGYPFTLGADGTRPELSMLFASCRHFEEGYFTACRRMAEEHPDLILHLGDYIYEGAATTTRVRRFAPAA